METEDLPLQSIPPPIGAMGAGMESIHVAALDAPQSISRLRLCCRIPVQSYLVETFSETFNEQGLPR